MAEGVAVISAIDPPDAVVPQFPGRSKECRARRLRVTRAPTSSFLLESAANSLFAFDKLALMLPIHDLAKYSAGCRRCVPARYPASLKTDRNGRQGRNLINKNTVVPA
jgi:hypothetical protein